MVPQSGLPDAGNHIFSVYKRMGKEHMNRKLHVKQEGKSGYDIWLEPDFDRLPAALAELSAQKRKICIVTDTHVAELYEKEIKQMLSGCCTKVSVFVFPAGEEHKTLDTVRSLYEHLIREQYDRKDLLAALGGGVVGDLTGFAAATYLRGIDFIQIPTTLLSQVDSSIGGKTGVDFDAYKNMVGAFHMPRLVYMNLSVLKSLPKHQFSSGMAEIIKHGLIQDQNYWQWLQENQEAVLEGDVEALLSMVGESCRIKGHVVEEDPTEQGIRAWLNYGHTIGHAVEKLKDFQMSHGECVAVGCVAAAQLSFRRGFLTADMCGKIERTFAEYGLPVRVEGLCPKEILKTTKLDKKMEAGAIKFVLLRRIGEAYVAKDVSDEELLMGIQYICKDKEMENVRQENAR